MKQCDCLDSINRKMNISQGTKDGYIVDRDLISGKTLSRFEYREKSGTTERAKIIRILHSYCPFCGKQYNNLCSRCGVRPTNHPDSPYCQECQDRIDNGPVSRLTMNGGTIIFPGEPDAGSYLCMPMLKNIPSPTHPDWKLVECPICGKGCWENDQHRELVKENPELKAACTECTLRAGMNGGAK